MCIRDRDFKRGIIKCLIATNVAARGCLLYTSDAADDMQCVDLGGRRIIKKRERVVRQRAGRGGGREGGGGGGGGGRGGGWFLMIRRPPRSTHCISSAASDVYKRQLSLSLSLSCLLYTSPSPRDLSTSRMPSSA